MKLFLSTTTALFALTLLITPAPAKALTLAEAVERIDAMIAEMTLLKSQLSTISTTAVPLPQVQGAQSQTVLTLSLEYGETNEDIAKVQRLLATDVAIYPYGVDSGFFGPKTQEAVRNFQARFGLDTVGVIGPATTALLELFMTAYPDENYPSDVLKKGTPEPQVLGETTTTAILTPVPASSTGGKYSKITVSEDKAEFIVRSYLKNGDRNRDLILYPEDEDELIEMAAQKLYTTEAEVESLLDVDEDWFRTDRNRADEDDAQDAIDDADEALDRVRNMIFDAARDGDDVDDAEELYDEGRDLLGDAEDALDDGDYDDAVEWAEEAEDLADDAKDEL